VQVAAVVSVVLYWSPFFFGIGAFSPELVLLPLFHPLWVPHALVAWRVGSNPRRWLGWAMAWGSLMSLLAAGAAVVLGFEVGRRGSLAETLAFAGFFLLPPWQGDARVVPWLWGVFAVVQAVLAVSAVKAAAAQPQLSAGAAAPAGPAKRGIRLRYFAYAGVPLALGLLLVALAQRSAEREHRIDMQPSQASGNLRALTTTLVVYQSTYGGYPATLKMLQEPREGRTSDCNAAGLWWWPNNPGLASGLASGVVNGYRYIYTPGPREDLPLQPCQLVKSYTLVARHLEYDAVKRWPPSYFVDETGVIGETRENRDASAADRPASAVTEKEEEDPELAVALLNLDHLTRSLASYRAAYGGYPARPEMLAVAPAGSKGDCNAAGLVGRWPADGVVKGYRYRYAPGPRLDNPVEGCELVKTYTLGARPLEYRYEAGTRPSFYTDYYRRDVRQTEEDREATASDPTRFSLQVKESDARMGPRLAQANLGVLNTKLSTYRARYGGYPARVEMLEWPPGVAPAGAARPARDRGGAVPAARKPDCNAAGLGGLPVGGVLAGYRYTYTAGPPADTPVSGCGLVKSYALTARPLEYRYKAATKPSFYTDQTGVIRQTRDDRHATAADLPAE